MAGAIEALYESLSTGRVVAALFLFTIFSFVLDFANKPKYPDVFPRVGYGKGLVASVKNYLSYLTSYRQWVQEGYEKHSKHGRPFVVPSAASRPHDVVLPQSQTMWMLEQPDKIVGTHEAHNEILYSQYNFLGKRLSDDVFHTRVIHKSIARALPHLVAGTQEEVQLSVDEVFGLDTENWKSFNVWDSWLGVVPKVTNRMLIGTPVNRDPELVKSMVNFTDDVVRNGFILGMIPKIFHPVVARLVCLPNWLHYSRGAKHTLPIIQKRLHDMERKAADDPAYEDWTEPEDFITWSIRLAKAEGNAFEMDPHVISKRILPVEFAAIHTTVLTGHSTILDLMSSNPDDGFLDGIREEATRVLAEENGQWTKDGLSRLYRIDSAIRESQRFSNFATTLVERKVLAPEGITNKTEGWHLPYGSFVTLNLQGLHHDPDRYQSPEIYNAFRFSRPREEYEAKPLEQKDAQEGLRLKKTGMVTTSDGHLAFGHGRHACPGRFFVAHELKMIIAYLAMNYEIKHLPARPKVSWMGQTIIPPLDARIEVRRRKGTVPA